MSDIYSWIDEAAESGRAVDYQDHIAAVNALRGKLDKARLAIHSIAHGKQSMRDYANKVLAETAIDDDANTESRGATPRKESHE